MILVNSLIVSLLIVDSFSTYEVDLFFSPVEKVGREDFVCPPTINIHTNYPKEAEIPAQGRDGNIFTVSRTPCYPGLEPGSVMFHKIVKHIHVHIFFVVLNVQLFFVIAITILFADAPTLLSPFKSFTYIPAKPLHLVGAMAW